ncbi:MAG: hypothetical protein WAU27_15625, partial [Pseudomonadales bacterium]
MYFKMESCQFRIGQAYPIRTHSIQQAPNASTEEETFLPGCNSSQRHGAHQPLAVAPATKNQPPRDWILD